MARLEQVALNYLKGRFEGLKLGAGTNISCSIKWILHKKRNHSATFNFPRYSGNESGFNQENFFCKHCARENACRSFINFDFQFNMRFTNAHWLKVKRLNQARSYPNPFTAEDLTWHTTEGSNAVFESQEPCCFVPPSLQRRKQPAELGLRQSLRSSQLHRCPRQFAQPGI